MLIRYNSPKKTITPCYGSNALHDWASPTFPASSHTSHQPPSPSVLVLAYAVLFQVSKPSAMFLLLPGMSFLLSWTWLNFSHSYGFSSGVTFSRRLSLSLPAVLGPRLWTPTSPIQIDEAFVPIARW